MEFGMNALYVIDAVALLFFLTGFHIAFRQRLVRSWVSRLRNSAGQPTPAGAKAERGEGHDEMASVLRIAGVMIMAFSLTICIFANLIAYYTAEAAH